MEPVFKAPLPRGETFLERTVDSNEAFWISQDSDSRGIYIVSGCPPPRVNRKAIRLGRMPESVMSTIFHFSKLKDCYSLTRAIRSEMLEDLLSEKIRLLNMAISYADNFFWSRYVGCLKWDHVSNRVGHNMSYMSYENSIYIFGGGNIDEVTGGGRDNRASFNDLWKLDLATMKCDKVFIRSAPYPLPKYNAVMLTYNNTLFLHGGRQALRAAGRKRTDFSSNEMHQFHPRHKAWTKFHTDNVAPSLSDHCGIVYSNSIIFYGGYTEKHDVSTCFHILNLTSRSWSSVSLEDIPSSYTTSDYDELPFSTDSFPPFQPGTYSLILLKPGYLLLFGLPGTIETFNLSVLIEFRLKDPSSTPWRWRVVKITGKFGKCELMPPILPPSTGGITRHPKVISIQCQTAIRLVSLGLPIAPNKELFYEVDGVSRLKLERLNTFLMKLSEKMLSDLVEVYRSPYRKNPNFFFTYDGISLKFCDFLVDLTKVKKSKKFDIGDTQIRMDVLHSSQIGVVLDEVDLYELRKVISNQAETLHLNRERGFCMVAEAGLYELPKLVTYSTLIDTSSDFEDVGDIIFEEGELHSMSTPALFRYEMVATEVDVIIMGGSNFQEDLKKPGSPVTGYIYTLTPSYTRYPAGK